MSDSVVEFSPWLIARFTVLRARPIALARSCSLHPLAARREWMARLSFSEGLVFLLTVLDI